MSSRAITIGGFVIFLVLGIVMNLLAHRRDSRLPTMGELFSRLMHDRTGRIAIVAWWAWLGMHLFSK